MRLNKNKDVIDKLNLLDAIALHSELVCWVKKEENYDIHIFSIQLKDEKELLNIKDDLRDYLAIYFQSQTLVKDIERWNIYQVFFIEESVSKDVKQQVEQDKFATRKLVFDNIDNIMTDEEIIKKINSEIFEFKLTKHKSPIHPLIDLLKNEDARLFSDIEKSNGDINILLKLLENE
jgi:tRNA G10  N-methylase Trm11